MFMRLKASQVFHLNATEHDHGKTKRLGPRVNAVRSWEAVTYDNTQFGVYRNLRLNI